MSDILLHKKTSVERCIKQAREYYTRPSATPFATDFLKQDAIIMNLQRAFQQCIDMANHIIRIQKLGLPPESEDSFSLLQKAGIIDTDMEKKMIAMVGFRNIIVHQYTDIDHKIVTTIIQKHTDDLLSFVTILATPPN